jgi:hypothetical protein
MLKELFSELFEKLKKENSNNSASKSGCFNFFETHILEGKYHKVNFVSSRSLINYYNKYVEGIANTAGEPNGELKDLIANYLEFSSYHDFENYHLKAEKKTLLVQSKNIFFKRSIIIKITAVITCILGGVSFMSSNFTSEENCITWNKTHFEEAPCNLKYSIDNTMYQLNIDNFKKIELDKETIFFKNGNAMVWYGKSTIGEMEYFTLRGVHPETLKELKPITDYIIKKYVLSTERDSTVKK